MVKTSPSSAGGVGSIPGRGAKIPRASQTKNQNIKQKQYCNKLNKDFKNGPHQKNLKKKKVVGKPGERFHDNQVRNLQRECSSGEIGRDKD